MKTFPLVVLVAALAAVPARVNALSAGWYYTVRQTHTAT